MSTSTSGEIILFDLPSKPPCLAWSLNPWKTRMLLNFKGLEYKTEWIEFPDIKPRFEKHVPPNTKGSAYYYDYTIPTIMLPDGTYVMDSWKIAAVIEERHPEPPVHLGSPQLIKLQEIMPRLLLPLLGIYYPLIPKRLLNQASVPFWYEKREKRVGMSLDQYEKEYGGEVAFSKAQPALQEVTALLQEDKSGPFFMGKTASYADFIWAGFLILAQRVGDDVFENMLERMGNPQVHLDFLEAVKPWAKRNDH